MVLTERVVNLLQSGDDVFTQMELKFPNVKRISIIRMAVKVEYEEIWADADEVFVSISKITKAAVVLPTDNGVIWSKHIVQVGAVAGEVDHNWLVQNLPSFSTDTIYFQFDTIEVAPGTNQCYITLLLDVKNKGGL